MANNIFTDKSLSLQTMESIGALSDEAKAKLFEIRDASKNGLIGGGYNSSAEYKGKPDSAYAKLNTEDKKLVDGWVDKVSGLGNASADGKDSRYTPKDKDKVERQIDNARDYACEPSQLENLRAAEKDRQLGRLNEGLGLGR